MEATGEVGQYSSYEYFPTLTNERPFPHTTVPNPPHPPVYLPPGTPAGADRRHLLHGGHVLPPAAPLRLPQVSQADGGGAVANPPPVRGGAAQVLDEERRQGLGAGEVGGDDRHEPPGALAGLGDVGLVAGGLLHQLAVDLVAELGVLVAVLWTRGGFEAGWNRGVAREQQFNAKMFFSLQVLDSVYHSKIQELKADETLDTYIFLTS